MNVEVFSPAMLMTALVALGLLFAGQRRAWIGLYLLPLLAVVSLLSYLALPPFSPLLVRKINLHDTAHYYLGAKYLKELGYERLYPCVVLADVQDDAYPEAFDRGRAIRDLRDNSHWSGDQLRHAGYRECMQHFSPGRWREFRADTAFLRQWSGLEAWSWLVRDHGFNATPVWAIFGGFVVDTVPLTHNNLIGMILLDYGLMLAAIGVLLWSFGLRTTSLAVLVLTTAAMAAPSWTRGSILRWDWLFSLALCWCLVHKQRWPLLAGGFGALAVGQRIFPLIFFLPWALHWLIALARKQPTSCYSRRFWIAFAGGGAALLAWSVLVFGPEIWMDFMTNLAKHQGNTSLNNIGWPMLQPLFPGDFAKSAVRAIQFAVIALVIWRVLRLSAKGEWALLGVGGLTLPFLAPSLANYYYMLLLLIATLSIRLPFLVPALLLANVASGMARWGIGESGAFTMYHLDAVLIVSIFGWALWCAETVQDEGRPPEA